MNLSYWFTHETTAFCMEQCTTPSLFHNFEVSQGTRNHSLKNYGFQFGMSFSQSKPPITDHLTLSDSCRKATEGTLVSVLGQKVAPVTCYLQPEN